MTLKKPVAFGPALVVVLFTVVNSSNIELYECSPPDYPQFGGYGPRQDVYLPGDQIHYYCDVDTYIGGNYLRICMDNGDWTGDAPVCDAPVIFETITQSSTAEPEYENDAEAASDGIRSTCSSTKAEPGSTWTGTLDQESQVLRVMLFLPRGDVAYDVISVKSDGSEYSCGRAVRRVERYEWVFHNCLEPNNTRIVAVKIKSLSSAPLQLCEVVVHTLTDPTCVDPHVRVENGQLILTRKTATLVCDRGYTKSRDSTLRCMRTGVWSRQTIYCAETEREVEVRNSNNRDR